MSRGVLEQLDTPSEIYARPRTLFVADFIGTMNVLDGRYRRDRQAVEVAGAWLPVADTGWPSDQAVRIAIRPEDLQPIDDQTPQTFSGRADVVMDLGHFRQVELVLTEGPTLKIFVPKERVITSGDRLRVVPTRCLAYSDTTEPVELMFADTPRRGALVSLHNS